MHVPGTHPLVSPPTHLTVFVLGVAHLSCDLHDPFCIVVMSALVMLVAAPPSAALPSRHDWFALLTLEVQSQAAKYICTVRPTKAEPGLPGFHIILRLD
jgi:hypothetical protein